MIVLICVDGITNPKCYTIYFRKQVVIDHGDRKRGFVHMKLSDFIGETTEYDKKETLEERKPKSWLKSVSAFANGIGGSLFFGVSDDEALVGLDDANHVAEK